MKKYLTAMALVFLLMLLAGTALAAEAMDITDECTIKASYSYVTKAEDFFDIAGFKQYESNPAFSGNQISISGNNRVVNFYYDRIVDHYLEFNNKGILLNDKIVGGIMYGAPVSQYNFTPDYPSNLEPGAYTFGGWYISPGCFDGTEVDWNTITMPEGDLMLYAKWKPITHTVKVFKDKNTDTSYYYYEIEDEKLGTVYAYKGKVGETPNKTVKYLTATSEKKDGEEDIIDAEATEISE